MIFKWLTGILVCLALVLAGIYFTVFHIGAVEVPSLAGELKRVEWTQPEGPRTFAYYVPKTLADDPAIVFALHGSRGDGALMRNLFAYEFDRLADEHGFIVVYPDGYQNHWNDCRASASYAANTEDIDDPAFFARMFAYFDEQYGTSASRRFVTGYSNGGHFGFRLIFEMPEHIKAVAAIAANLPVEESRDCDLGDQPVSLALINGTLDPVNPYEGGLVEILGDKSRGTVHSSLETIDYFKTLAGITEKANETHYPEHDGNADTAVSMQHWQSPSGIEVRLLTLKGSGHVVPSRQVEYGRFFGPEARDIEAAEEIWQFFSGLSTKIN